MANELQLRRGSTAAHATFVGKVGEVTFDTDKKMLVGHDGETEGGFPQGEASAIIQTNGRSVQHHIDNTGIQDEWASGASYAYKDSEWWLDGVLYKALKNTSVDPVGDNVNWRANSSFNKEDLGRLTKYQAASVADMIEGITVGGETVTPTTGQVWSTGGTIWERLSLASGDISDFMYLSDVHIADWGVIDNVDATSVMIEVAGILKGGASLDLGGLRIRQSNQGINTNTFGSLYSADNNRTCYFYLNKKNNITIKNGSLVADVDMTNDCLILAGFQGCQDVTFDNVHFDLQASGTPFFSVNGYETFCGLISFMNDADGTQGKNLTIKSNCTVRINHPDGGSVGPQDGNSVHTYSGKLVGIDYWGTYSQTTPIWIEGLNVESGVKFYECTARVIWCWMHRNINIGDLQFIDCGVQGGQAHSLIRMLHGGENVTVGNQQVKNCWVGTPMVLSNNGGPWHPTNVTIGDWNIIGGGGTFAFNLLDGIDVTIGTIKNNGGDWIRVLSCLFTTNATPNNIVINGVVSHNTDSLVMAVGSKLDGTMVVKSVIGEGVGAGATANGIVLDHSGDGELIIQHAKVSGYNYGLLSQTNAENTKVYNFDFSGNLADGISFFYNAMGGSEWYDGKCNNNGARGMRIPPDAIVRDITAIGNVGNQLEVNANSTLNGFTVDDGANTSLTSAGVGMQEGITGWVIRDGIIKSSNSKFKYGINASQVGTITHNDFIGTVGTTAKWTTFGGSTVVGNTPTDTP